jgi:hypothetical protein
MLKRFSTSGDDPLYTSVGKQRIPGITNSEGLDKKKN